MLVEGRLLVGGNALGISSRDCREALQPPSCTCICMCVLVSGCVCVVRGTAGCVESFWGGTRRTRQGTPTRACPEAPGTADSTGAASVKGGGGAAAGVVPRPPAAALATVSRRGVAALAATARIGGSGQSLDDAVPGEHAAVDGEVAADHEGAHGGVFLGQDVRLVGEVRLILAAVDEDEASVSV